MSYAVPPRSYGDADRHRQMIAEALAGVMVGHTNNVGSVTLTASSATTVLKDNNLTINSAVLFMPVTAHAATEIATLYVDTQGKGTATIHHANNAQADRTFRYIIVG